MKTLHDISYVAPSGHCWDIPRNIWGVAAVLIVSLLLGCERKSQVDSKDDPSVYCRPYSKEVGEVVEYVGVDGKPRRNSQFEDYKTAAGFRMRVPTGVGGLGHPNKQCQMESGEFEFRWVNGQLLPSWDYKTGKRNLEGSLVQYFVRFSPPAENPVEKFDYPGWMFEGAFRIPGHEKILVLPHAERGGPEHVPADRNNRDLWRPRLLLEDSRDLAGNPIMFFCGGLSYEEKDGALHVTIKDFRRNTSKCMGGPKAFANGAGGRLDIYDEDFFGQGAAITNAVIKELNNYIIRE